MWILLIIPFYTISYPISHHIKCNNTASPGWDLTSCSPGSHFLNFSGLRKSWSIIRYKVFCNACTFFKTSFPCFVIWKLKKIQTLFFLSETKLSEDCIVPVKPKAVLIRNQYFSDPERNFRCFILAKYLWFVTMCKSRKQ